MHRSGAALLLVCLSFSLASCEDAEARKEGESDVAAMELQHEPVLPLPPAPALDPALVALGNRLYHDPLLSADGTVSCASCHVIANGGDDDRASSVGISGQVGEVNAPTVLNSGLNFVQFWDGRAKTLEDQAGGPIENPIEMGSTWAAVLDKLRKEPSYVAAFAGVFPSGISEQNVRAAIAAFERTLVTPDAKFDRWLKGDKKALSTTEMEGYELFKSVGCIACHQGRNVGGNMFQRFGVFVRYLEERGNPRKSDFGRFNVTGNEADKFVFRVPSLRNVELTAPYFHDGSAATLEDAVRTMARVQLGRPLSDANVAQIVSFLKTLTGRLPELRIASTTAGSKAP